MGSSLIPTALPDECLYSLAAAFTARWHQGEAKAVRTVLGSATRLARDLPSKLDEIAANFPAALNMSGRHLALHHTALPLHLPFVQPRDRERLITLCCTDAGIHLRFGIAPAKGSSSPTLRLCKECLRADVARFGRAYWHRTHQLPGVVVCPHHDSPLTNSVIRPHEPGSLVVEAEAAQVDSDINVPRSAFGDAQWLALSTFSMLIEHSLAPGREKLWAFYVNEATARGYAMPNGSIAVTRLCADFVCRFGQELLVVLGCTDIAWIKAMFRRPRGHQQPLRHLLLCRFFGIEVHDALVRASALNPENAPCGVAPNHIKSQDRLVRLLPAKRASWLQAQQLFGPKARDRAAPVYSWLHRNDRAWLRSTRGASRPRTPNMLRWEARDAALVERIKEAKLGVLHERGPRASRSYLARRVGQWSWLAKDHPFLPRSCETIRQESESAVDHAVRRLTAFVQDHGPVEASWRARVACGISTSLAKNERVALALKDTCWVTCKNKPVVQEMRV